MHAGAPWGASNPGVLVNGLAGSWPSGSVTTAQRFAATIKHTLLCIDLSVGPC